MTRPAPLSMLVHMQAAHAEISALQSACDSLKATLANMHTTHAAAEREVAILKEAKEHRVSTVYSHPACSSHVSDGLLMCLLIAGVHLPQASFTNHESCALYGHPVGRGLTAFIASHPGSTGGRTGRSKPLPL